ncbi:MAG: helicase-related protein [Verrucomicrobiota bacterium]
MPHDILDNRTPETLLTAHLQKVLIGTDKAKFAIGYFFLSGFKEIENKLDQLKELRLLIGTTTTRDTIEQLAEGYKRLDLVESVTKRAATLTKDETKAALQHTAADAQETLSLMDQTDQDQQLVSTLIKMVEEKRLKVKVYTKGRLHAKAYIFDFPPNSPYGLGQAVVGSSNLTLAGIKHNTELNVVVHGDKNHEELTKWFEDLWAEGKDFDAALLQELKQSWAAQQPTPYEIYLKTLWHLVKDRLEGGEDVQLVLGMEMPELTDFQKIAMKQAIALVEEHGGCFVGDVVGLGKTFIGAAILRYYKERRKMKSLILCPASLEETWNEFNEAFDLNARVESTGMLQEGDGRGIDLADKKYADRDIVLIDESHNFRYPDTQRYKKLQPFLTGKRTVLLTATPRNNSAWDVYHQMRLFLRDESTLQIDPPQLKGYFECIEPLGEKTKKHLRDHPDQRRELPSVLRPVLIRRTRKHIIEHYSHIDEKGRPYIIVAGKHRYFPKRDLEVIQYFVDKAYAGNYEEIRQKLMSLAYAKYGLWLYVEPSKRDQEPYASLQRAGKNLRGIMKSLLYKRLESSVKAFQVTIKDLTTVHERFLKALDNGIVAVGEEMQKFLYETDLDDETSLVQALQGMPSAGLYKIEDFIQKGVTLRKEIAHDIRVLNQVSALVEPLGPKQDDKLQTLLRWLHGGCREAKPLKPRDTKILIFTQYAETARYLYDNLKHLGGVAWIHSDTKNRFGLIRRFAPTANNYAIKPADEPIRILISTDVLSEGLNLQDASCVINYDIHWNPVRLIQRIGRIDRIGSEYDAIHVFNFLPCKEIDRELHLYDKVHKRIDEFQETIGADSQHLDRTERINDKAMYAIYQKEVAQLDLFDEEQDTFGLAEAEELIRQLEKTNPALLDRIKNLPDGVRSARSASGQVGTFVFFEARKFKRLWLVDPEGKAVEKDAERVVAAIKCDETQTKLPLPKGYNERLNGLFQQFKADAKLRTAALDHTAALHHAQKYVVRELNVIYRDTNDTELKSRLELLDRFVRQDPSVPLLKEYHFLKRQGLVGEPLVKRVTDLYFKYPHDQAPHTDEQGRRLVAERIICSEALL